MIRAIVNDEDVSGERPCMTPANNARRRVAIAGALAFVAAAVPVVIGLTASEPAMPVADGDCLAWFGSRGDGLCIGRSNGNPTYIGTPQLGIYGPGYGTGLGITSGPLLPGQTITQGINP